MRRLAFTWLGLAWLALSAPAGFAASISDFANFSLTSGGSTLLPGRLYIPPAAISDPAVDRPLILFLHGAGESGTNNTAQVNGNIDNLLAEAKRRGAFLYAPQTNGGWANSTILGRVNSMLDRALAEQPIDTRRVYVTGLSMGGGGTWNMLSAYGDRFAAAVPICGVSPTAGFVAGRLTDDAIWAFHALNDGTVSYTSTRNVVRSILAAADEPAPIYPQQPTTDFTYVSPALDLRQTEYRTGGHGIWGRVYNTPAVYTWMFAHAIVPEPAGLAVAAMAMAGLAGPVRRRRARPGGR